MLTKLSLFLCVICAIVLVGCAKKEANTNSGATNGNANKAATTASPVNHTTTASARQDWRAGMRRVPRKL